MTDHDLRFDELAEPLREPVAKYIDRLRTHCGPRLLSVAIYGTLEPVRSGEPVALSNALVLDAVDLELLAPIARDGGRFGRLGIAAPWALTPALIDDSRSSFPLELIEIQQQHTTVYGPNYFEQLEFDPAHVRLQCERELKVIEIHLQRGFLAAAGSERALGRLGTRLSWTMIRILRGLAWLEGDRQPTTTYPLVASIESWIAHALPGIRRMLDDSQDGTWVEFAQLHADVRTLRETVDRWQ